MHISKHSFFSSQDHGRLPDEDMSKHSHEKRALTLKTTVGGPPCTCPSIHLSAGERRSQDHGQLPAVYASMCAEITLCGHHLRPSLFPSHQTNKNIFFYLGIRAGHTERRQRTREITGRHHTRDNRHKEQNVM